MSQTFHPLTVKEKINETADAVSIVFDVPPALKQLFVFEAGQYITLKHKIADEEIRRSYSICTAPHENSLNVNVKRVDGGRMSSFVVDTLEVGNTLEVGIPEGNFTMNFDADKRRNHYFIAAGSGITPVMSLIKNGLEREPKSNFILLYGSRREKDIIFYSQLNALCQEYGDQLRVVHTLSKVKSGGLRGLFGKNKSTWDGWTGRINSEKIEKLFAEIPLNKIENHFFLCGPGELISSTQQWLSEKNIPGVTIHKEYFTNPDQSTGEVLGTTDATLSYANLHGDSGQINVPAGKTLLEALMDAGMDPPYSCMNGVCSSCVAKLVKGKVEMETCLALEDDEIQAGYILTCQSHPVTTELELEYDG